MSLVVAVLQGIVLIEVCVRKELRGLPSLWLLRAAVLVMTLHRSFEVVGLPVSVLSVVEMGLWSVNEVWNAPKKDVMVVYVLLVGLVWGVGIWHWIQTPTNDTMVLLNGGFYVVWGVLQFVRWDCWLALVFVMYAVGLLLRLIVPSIVSESMLVSSCLLWVLAWSQTCQHHCYWDTEETSEEIPQV